MVNVSVSGNEKVVFQGILNLSNSNQKIINCFKETSPDEISLAQETPLTLGALVGFLLGRRGGVSRVVMEVLVPLQQLLFPKALVALVALKRFLVCVYQHVIKAALGG